MTLWYTRALLITAFVALVISAAAGTMSMFKGQPLGGLLTLLVSLALLWFAVNDWKSLSKCVRAIEIAKDSGVDV